MSRPQNLAVTATVALAAVATLFGVAGQAAANSGPSAAQKSAEVVLKATGTEDLAVTVATDTTPARASTPVATGTVTVTAPRTAAAPVTSQEPSFGGFGLSLDGATDTTGTRTPDGTVVYPAAKPSTDFAVQATKAGGSRALVTLKDRSASNVQRYKLDLPSDVRIAPDGRGGYDLLKQMGNALVGVGHIDAPWAKDDRGKAVPTHYSLDGNTLVQSVDTNEGTAFPVVADPHFTWGIVTGTAYFNKNETRTIATRADWVGLIAPSLPFPFNTVVEAYKEFIKTYAQHAQQMNMCVKVKSNAQVGIYGGNDGDGYCR
ncbi:hypothetical protein AB0O91_39920 [Kitasatospora sp. NPDC089797]|uniref:hypothetical protein n=1 Tax=Kitasatospora sp. NPDC089797 TaxID=3155298 RepID=UPI003443D933